MIPLVLRKIARNPGLASSLAAGVLLAAALASGIPQYTEGVLEALLHRELADRESAARGNPGAFTARASFWRHGGAEDSIGSLPILHERVVDAMDYGLPTRFRSLLLEAGPFFVRASSGEAAAAPATMLTLRLVEGLEGRIRRVGPTAAPAAWDPSAAPGTEESPLGVYLAEEAARGLDLRVGERYLLVGVQGVLSRDLWIRLEGTFEPESALDPFWEGRYVPSRPALYADGGAVDLGSVAGFGFPRLEAEWLCVVEHSSLTVRRVSAELALIERRRRTLGALGIAVSSPLTELLEEFQRRERAIRLTLLFLQVPVWLLLLFFISDASRLLVRHDRSEIAVLMGRGASGAQVLGVYALIAACVAVCAVAAGPPLGLLAGRLLGSTTGFLGFVRRSPLPVALSLPSYAMAVAAALIFAAVMLPPALSASRLRIVERRRIDSRPAAPLWKRFFLDLGLLAASGYGLYGGLGRGRILNATGVSPAELPLDPLLFLASVLFLLGSSLLFVRLFPLALEPARRAAAASRSVVAHAALLHLSRDGTRRDSAMALLVFTVAVGVFGASTARTMNRHFEDAVRQRIGADVTLIPLWAGPDDALEACRRLPGVEAATGVFRWEGAGVDGGRGGGATASLMGVTPAELGRVAWWRRDLYPSGFARLLNTLASRQDGLLVSRSLAGERGIERGDSLSLSWGDRSSVRGVVLGVFDHWPGHDPRSPSGASVHLVVANLPYLEAMTPVASREIWIRRDPRVSRPAFYAGLRDTGLVLAGLEDAEGEVGRSREGPFVRGINGMLTLGFLACVAVCAAGLAMHGVVGLRERELELGVQRAAGLSRSAVTATLGLEQSVMLLCSVLAGVALGGVGGQLFIPLLQTATGVAERIIPFVVGAAREDYRNVMIFAGVVLCSSLGVLGGHVRALRVAETLKLGEQ